MRMRQRKYGYIAILFFIATFLTVAVTSCKSGRQTHLSMNIEEGSSSEKPVQKAPDSENRVHLTKKTEAILNSYIAGKTSYDEALHSIDHLFARAGGINEILEDALDHLNILLKSELHYNRGLSLFHDGDSLNALKEFSCVAPDDPRYFKLSQQNLIQCRTNLIEIIKKEILFSNYIKSLNLLKDLQQYLPADEEIARLISQSQNKLNNPVLYQGPIEHIFFHDLIIYPELAFDSDHKQNFYDSYFVTIDEFRKILEELYANQYILINAETLWKESIENGNPNIDINSHYLPEGKKPLVISVDDVNYYNADEEHGLGQKLVLDGENKFATVCLTPEGKQIIRYDADVVTILEAFIEINPDFSWNGAKAVLGFTGFEGILGYDTHLPSSSDYKQEREEAQKVVNKLKELGWVFASHSYHHRDIVKNTFDFLVYDTERWLGEVGCITGKTQIYLYPYGANPGYLSTKYKYLVSRGFKLMCEVGSFIHVVKANGGLSQGRRQMDGMAFEHKHKLKALFDVDKVICPLRP